jgi:hypothetical protein
MTVESHVHIKKQARNTIWKTKEAQVNSEFHYYTLAFLAVKAGFRPQEAQVLAWSSQYVDHNQASWKIHGTGFILTTKPTQNYQFWKPDVVQEILIPFHFIPVGPSASFSGRLDQRINFWDVQPNSSVAKRLLFEALSTKNLFQIGIAFHAWSDTWAHQNFSALFEDWNRMDARTLIPPVGHAQAGTAPDEWLGEWTDPRLKDSYVVNKLRFLECAHKTYRYLCLFQGKDFKVSENEVLDELSQIIEKGRGRAKENERVLDFILATDIPPYDRGQWLGEACEKPENTLPDFDFSLWEKMKRSAATLRERSGLGPPLSVRAKPGFQNSSFYRWIKAAEEHRKSAQRLLNELFPSWKSFPLFSAKKEFYL